MKKVKSAPTCQYEGCLKKNFLKKKPGSWSRFCNYHDKKATVSIYLGRVYTLMKRRVRGKNTGSPELYRGLPVMPKDVFLNWAKNHPDFLAMYKRWKSNNFDMKLTPSVNRMNSKRGYVLGNVEWLTHSQNCGLSSEVKRMKQKKAIYELLGVK